MRQSPPLLAVSCFSLDDSKFKSRAIPRRTGPAKYFHYWHDTQSNCAFQKQAVTDRVLQLSGPYYLKRANIFFSCFWSFPSTIGKIWLIRYICHFLWVSHCLLIHYIWCNTRGIKWDFRAFSLEKAGWCGQKQHCEYVYVYGMMNEC